MLCLHVLTSARVSLYLRSAFSLSLSRSSLLSPVISASRELVMVRLVCSWAFRKPFWAWNQIELKHTHFDILLVHSFLPRHMPSLVWPFPTFASIQGWLFCNPSMIVNLILFNVLLALWAHCLQVKRGSLRQFSINLSILLFASHLTRPRQAPELAILAVDPGVPPGNNFNFKTFNFNMWRGRFWVLTRVSGVAP